MKKKLKKSEYNLLQKALKENPNIKVNGVQKSQQKGHSDLPLFFEDKQQKLF